MGCRSAQDFALSGVAGEVEELDLIDGLKMGVVGEFPNDFLVARDLEKMRLFAEMAVSKIIAADRIAVGQTLDAGHQAQWIAGDFIFTQFPHGFQRGIEFDHFVTVAAGDEQMAVG